MVQMMTSDFTPSPDQSPYLLLKELKEKFAVFREGVPLAIGIDKQMFALLPEINRKALRNALAIHTNSLQYLKKMQKAIIRYDLDGNAADEVTEIHRTYAAQTLRERLQKKEAQQKVQRNAEQALRRADEAQRQAEEAARQRVEKLNLLAAKFARVGS